MDSPYSRPYRLPCLRWLLVMSLAFVALVVLDTIVSLEGRASTFDWGGVTRLGAVWLLFFWFAIFVFASEDRGRFRARRRFVHAVAFGAWLTASALLVHAPVPALPIVFLASLPIGYFATSWLQWL